MLLILRRSHGQVTKVPGQAPHITTEYSADIRYRTTRARVCLHIQKPKPEATIKMIEKIHELFDVHNTIHKRWLGYGCWDGNVTAATNKTHNPALTAWF